MLLSRSHNFIFVANLKTASTSIELLLRPYSDIALLESISGKHMTLSQIERKFSEDVTQIRRKNGLIFGVIRDPVDYVLSLYNSHLDEKFALDPSLYTGKIDFSEFISVWCQVHADQLLPQSARFRSGFRSERPCTILRFERLETELRPILGLIGVPDAIRLPRENVSPGSLRRSDLKRKEMQWIRTKFIEDYILIARLEGHIPLSESQHASR